MEPKDTKLKSRYKLFYTLSVLALGGVLLALFCTIYTLVVAPVSDPDSVMAFVYLVLTFGGILLVSQAMLVFTRFIAIVGKDEKKIEELRDELDQLKVMDPLTRVYNRFKFERVIGRELENVRRYANPLSGVMFDIDDFKNINEEHGYPAGDKLLVNVAQYVSGKLRNTDYLFRWRGGKFIILAPHTDIDNAGLLAEKLRELVGHKLFGGKIRLTLSLGVIQAEKDDSMESFLQRIQASLTSAKNNGKDRVVISRY